jgi:hypothetical protein
MILTRRITTQALLITGIILIVCVSSSVSAQDGPGSTGAEYLTRAIGPKSIAMGEINAALEGDPFSWLVNPASFGFIEGTGFGVLHSEWIVETKYNNASLHHRFNEKFVAAGSFTFEYRPDIQGFDIYGMETKTLKNNNYQAILGLGYSPVPSLTFGANAKYFQEKLDEWTSGGAAFDVGALYSIDRVGVAVGIAVQNIGSDIKFDTIEEPLPMTMRAGATHAFDLGSGTTRLMYGLDLVKPRYDDVYISAGVELDIMKTLAVRAGYCGQEYRLGDGVTLGGGVSLGGGLKLDYAWTPYGDLGNFHRISVYFNIR